MCAEEIFAHMFYSNVQSVGVISNELRASAILIPFLRISCLAKEPFIFSYRYNDRYPIGQQPSFLSHHNIDRNYDNNFRHDNT